MIESSDQAALFRALHHHSEPLLLANVWDAASARLAQSLGARAVATTSAGLAWALGYPDGNAVPIDEHVGALRRIARCVSCPVSADAEAGYSDNPATVADHVMRLTDAGVVGINIEDGAGAPAALARKIEAIRSAAARSGVALFVNARTDVLLKQLVASDQAVAETRARATLYAQAGADGIFVPMLATAQGIEALVAGQALPLNVMACPGLPDLPTLTRLGVRRLSAGSAIAQAAWAEARRKAADFLRQGCTNALFDGAATFGEVNTLFKPTQA